MRGRQQHTRGTADLPSTLLQRVILPRKADPLAVRALYIDEQRAADLLVRSSSNAVTGRRSTDVDREITFTIPNQLRPADRQARQGPQLNLARQDTRWFALSGMDGMIVSTADGQGVTYRRRDLKALRSLMAHSIAPHRELAREFPRLRKRYRAAAEELTSLSGWKRVFDA